MAQFTELQVHTALVVGEQRNADGAVVKARGGKQGDAIVSQLHGSYFEAALNQRLFYSHCPAVAMSAPATAAIGNIIWNPPNSGIVAALGKWSACYQVTDADAMAMDMCYSVQATLPTTATVATTGSCYLAAVGASTSKCKAYSIATIVTAATPIYRLAHLTAAINTVGEYQLEGDFGGGIIVPPGYLVSIHTIAAAGTAGITTSVWWEEVPI